jgi:hypothetical protein
MSAKKGGLLLVFNHTLQMVKWQSKNGKVNHYLVQQVEAEKLSRAIARVAVVPIPLLEILRLEA